MKLIIELSPDAVKLIKRINHLALESQDKNRVSKDDDIVFSAIAGISTRLLEDNITPEVQP